MPDKLVALLFYNHKAIQEFSISELVNAVCFNFNILICVEDKKFIILDQS